MIVASKERGLLLYYNHTICQLHPVSHFDYVFSCFMTFFPYTLRVHARLAQLVEHHIDIVGVTGSSPVSRTFSKNSQTLCLAILLNSRPGLEDLVRNFASVSEAKCPQGVPNM